MNLTLLISKISINKKKHFKSESINYTLLYEKRIHDDEKKNHMSLTILLMLNYSITYLNLAYIFMHAFRVAVFSRESICYQSLILLQPSLTLTQKPRVPTSLYANILNYSQNRLTLTQKPYVLTSLYVNILNYSQKRLTLTQKSTFPPFCTCIFSTTARRD